MLPTYMYINGTEITGTYIQETPQGSNYFVTYEDGYDAITIEPRVFYELVYHSHYVKVQAYFEELAVLEQARAAAWQEHLTHLRNN